MLAEGMIAAAAGGGMAVVQAAGTEAWVALRAKVAEIFHRSAPERELAVLERLDQTQELLRGAAPDDLERLRVRQEASWQTVFESLLEGLDDSERQGVITGLHELREAARRNPGGTASSGQAGMAVRGDVSIRADSGSAAAGVINGGVRIGDPTLPGAEHG